MTNNIQALRLENGLSVSELATYLNVTPSYITKIEKGEFEITSALETKLIQLFLCNKKQLTETVQEQTMLYSFTAKDVTFKNNNQISVHRWYPYIEGYSEVFVKNILSNYNNDKTVYDPFNGSGTTMLTSAYMGFNVLASEINPLMRFIADTKVNSVYNIINDVNKVKLLESYIDSYNNIFDNEYPDVMDSKYINDCYINDNFFEDSVIKQLAYIKSTIQGIFDIDVKAVLRLALAAIIVDSSNMIRAADLRRRTPDEYDNQGGAISRFKSKLNHILSDILSLEIYPLRNAIFISDNAKAVDCRYRNSVDVVITSPPYMNGTNYFRNTKLELWILDFISNRDDLKSFRRQAITAGINNVSSDIRLETTFDFVEIYASKLDEISPDKRIPKMVRAYFNDMSKVFSNMEMMLREDGKIYFDIGDSEYYGVHIPVDELIVVIAERCGLTLSESIITRKRKSKKGTTLTQKLLVFTKGDSNL